MMILSEEKANVLDEKQLRVVVADENTELQQVIPLTPERSPDKIISLTTGRLRIRKSRRTLSGVTTNLVSLFMNEQQGVKNVAEAAHEGKSPFANHTRKKRSASSCLGESPGAKCHRKGHSRGRSGSFSLSGGFNMPSPKQSPSKLFQDDGDRFIPNRRGTEKNMLSSTGSNENSSSLSLDFSSPLFLSPFSPKMSPRSCQAKEREQVSNDKSESAAFQTKLAETLFEGTKTCGAKMLAFKPQASPSKDDAPADLLHHDLLRTSFHQHNSIHTRKQRLISGTPDRILDAPDLVDDYYLNVLDWSKTNVLAVGLGSCLYLWNSSTSEIDLLVDNGNPDNIITSLKWNSDGDQLAVGSADSTVKIWDANAKKIVGSHERHSARVAALSWSKSLISSGGRDGRIHNQDVRMATPLAALEAHEEEICGLAWSPDGSQLASGGNDNICCIWDRSLSSAPRFTFDQHEAAVKALAWCPFQKNVLATGGGTADRHIRFFNTSSGDMLNSVDTKSQVCSLRWSKTGKELLSAHGFSQNQLTLWKYPAMNQIANLTGHTKRVLHTATSPDGSTVVSAAADETLRFWKVWDSAKSRKGKHRRESSLLSMRNIR